MRIARCSAVALAALSVGLTATAVQAGSFTRSNSPDVDNAIVVSYDPADGNLSFKGNGQIVTTLELKSTGGLFIPGGVNDNVIPGPFDILNPAKFFRLDTNGLTELNMGKIVPAGLSADAIIADMQVSGSKKPAGGLEVEGGPYLYVVPEPSSLALVCCGLLGLLRLRRK